MKSVVWGLILDDSLLPLDQFLYDVTQTSMEGKAVIGNNLDLVSNGVVKSVVWGIILNDSLVPLDKFLCEVKQASKHKGRQW